MLSLYANYQLVPYFLVVYQVTVYQCLEGGVIAVLQSYIDEDVRNCKFTVVSFVPYICSHIL